MYAKTQRQMDIDEAKTTLEIIRERNPGSEQLLILLLEKLRKKGISFQDVGTSAEELRILRTRTCTANSQDWLRYIKQDGANWRAKKLVKQYFRGSFMVAIEDIKTI